MKKFLEKAFQKQNSKIYHKVNNFYALLTIVSIVSLVLETVSALTNYSQVFVYIEWISVILFAGEYLGRLSISKPIWKYPTSFFGVVDLVAILPTFLGMGNFTFLKSARSLRIIRLLRMARLAKMARSGPSKDDLGVASFNILIYFTTLTTALLILGTAMYLIEPEMFKSIPSGMWWSFKVFMAGIPVIEPATTLGEMFFVLTRFVGLLLLGLLVGVVGNVFRALLFSGSK